MDDQTTTSQPLDQAGPSAGEVLAFMNASPAPGAADKSTGRQEEDTPSKEERVEIKPEDLFKEDAVEAEFKNMIELGDDKVEVTEMDKNLFLKATLNDVEVVLPVTVMGSIEIRVRSLNNCEQDLIWHAIKKLSTETEMLPLMYESMVQRYTMAMQLVRFNNQPVECLRFSSDMPLAEAADRLINGATHMFGGMSTLKYGMCFRAVNVFNHKMARMQTMALNRDFWNPGDIA